MALNFEFTAPACRYCFYQVLLPLLSPYFLKYDCKSVTLHFRCIFHLPSIFPHFLSFFLFPFVSSHITLHINFSAPVIRETFKAPHMWKFFEKAKINFIVCWQIYVHY
jgi:hypothetical protein